MASLASDGTVDLTKLRWQFSVVIRSTVPRRNTPFYERSVRTCGIRAIVGRTAVPFLEDDRLRVSIADLGAEMFPNIVHNIYIANVESIILHGLIPGGGGITRAMHSQLSAFHMMDERLQESSRARMADAIIVFNVAKKN
ncbi:MAG: hypothetical protein ACKPKO_52795 [Candidatus Fonsibacter sp.]